MSISHIANGEAKFWRTPGVQLATLTSLNQHLLRESQSVVENHLGEIANAWHCHFST